jgi:hypothetical protein
MISDQMCWPRTFQLSDSLFHDEIHRLGQGIQTEVDDRRHDTKHNDIRPNDIQPNDTKHRGLISDIEHNDTQHNDTQNNKTLPLC